MQINEAAIWMDRTLWVREIEDGELRRLGKEQLTIHRINVAPFDSQDSLEDRRARRLPCPWC